MKRRGVIVALVVSLALHAASLAWLWTIPSRVARAPSRAPIQVELVFAEREADAPSRESDPESATAPLPAPVPRAERQRDPLEAAPPSELRPNLEAPPSEPLAGEAAPEAFSPGEPNAGRPGPSILRRVDLFDPNAIAEGAKIRGDRTSSESDAPRSENPVQDLLDAATFGRRHGPRRSPAMKELAVRLDSWFDPPVGTVRASGRAERRSIAERLMRYLASPPRESLITDDEYLDPFQVDDFRPDRAGLLCLTGCSGSHLVAKLLVLIEIDHTQVPVRATVLVSSGYADYDRAALKAVEDYAASESAELPIDAAQTHWTFESEVYRYRRDELLLDPQFEPPGRRIDESFGYVYSLDTRIKMVAVAEAVGDSE